MKKAIILILASWSLVACSQSGSENTQASTAETSVETPVQEAESAPEDNLNSETASTENKLEKADFDFLSDCNSLEVWRGAIQGVPPSDSTGVFIMAQCAANRDYDLVVFSKKEIDLGTATVPKRGGLKPGLPGASYYAFEIPKKEAENPEEQEEAFEYVFPSEVKVYKLFNDGWYLIDRQNVASFEQLGRLKLNTLYQKNRQQPNI